MIDRLEAIEQGLRVWRLVVLILTIVMLVVSILQNNQMSVIVLIICFFALILFQLRTLPITSYQLFIILQFAYLVFLFGKLLEDLYSNPSKALANALRNLFFMFTLVLFMAVLWRHYQKDQLVSQLNIDEEVAEDV